MDDNDATTSPWNDLDAYLALPRPGPLALSADGTRLMVSVSGLNADKTRFQSSWWAVDPSGERPTRRLTRSAEGESFGTFLADGSFVFGSKRPLPPTGEAQTTDDDTSALWLLPPEGGEAYPLVRRSGGYSGIVAPRESNRLVATVPMHAGTPDDEADAAKRAERKKLKVNAILHETYPVRFWDSDLGPVADRLVRLDLTTNGDHCAVAHPLTPDVGRALDDAHLSISSDGNVVVTDWSVPRPGGELAGTITSIDVATGQRRTLASDVNDDFFFPVVSSDGTLVACFRTQQATATEAGDSMLWLIRDGRGHALAPAWDAWPMPVAFSPDNAILYAVADDDGDRPIFAVDIDSGQVRRLTGAGSFSSVLLSPDGTTLYAIRSSYSDPGSVVAVEAASGRTWELESPFNYPDLPGHVERIQTTAADGTRVPGYLIMPESASASAPAPMALWVHGGPLSSWNSWSWRWCPWLLVSQGWAVLLPDPALSTGYGLDYIQRGWGRWGSEPFTDLMSIVDAVVARDDIDTARTVAMGGSFGGYMANWIAGHTDRFKAIVTHASLWNLENFGNVTDAAWEWSHEMTPEMRAHNSPHHHIDQIRTPLLVIHGDKDYRVPVGEGIALWWALVSTWKGPQEEFPHKFLYFPDENHWILTPQHAKIWYDTVRSFVNAAIGGDSFTRPALL